MTDLGELLFGENNREENRKIFFSDSLTNEQARKLLDSITHPEIRGVLNNLQTQMEEGKEEVRYEADYLNVPNDSEHAFLFSDWSYGKGFIQVFYSLLDKAFPDYKTTEAQPICEVLMKKVF